MKLRILLFAMNAADVEEEVRPIIDTVIAAGHACVRVNYWTRDYLPVAAMARRDVPCFSLIEGGLALAPRLTESDYRACGGPPLDFADVALHEHAVNGWAPEEQRLNLESPYYQRLRGVALLVRGVIRAIGPDLIVLPHGAEVISRLIAIQAADLDVPALVSESSFFPGFLNLDVGAQHFFRGLSRIDHAWPAYAAASDGDARPAYLDRWRDGLWSKYPQRHAAAEVERVERFLSGPPARLVFLPAQLPGDANVIPGLGAFATLQDLYESALDGVPADWKLLVKTHPRDLPGRWKSLQDRPNVLVVDDLDIRHGISRADVVMVHSSNVGFEALLLGKPVVVLGRPYYGGRGFTVDADPASPLGPALEAAAGSVPDPLTVQRFLRFLVEDHLIPIGDAGRLQARLDEARRAPAEQRKALAALAPHYGIRARSFLDAIHAYDALAKRNHFDPEIRAMLGGLVAAGQADRSDLDSGERQVPIDFADVEPAHLARYALADALIEPGCRILDIACGCGYGTHLLARRAGEAVGVDASEAAIGFAAAQWGHDRARFVAASAGTWPDRVAGEFDVCVSFETVEHVYDHTLLLGQLWRCLKPGGTLIVSTPNRDWYPIGDNRFHVRHFDPAGVRALLGGLEGSANLAVWTQDDRTIGPEVRRGRFIVGLATKGAPSSLRAGFAAILPFRLTTLPRRDRIHIGAALFSTNAARKCADRIVTSFDPTDTHVVFGPYRRLEAGRYRIAFELQAAAGSRPGDGRLALEVVDGKDRFLASRNLSGGELAGNRPESLELSFENADPSLALEFRVHASGRPVSGELSFLGVRLTRL